MKVVTIADMVKKRRNNMTRLEIIEEIIAVAGKPIKTGGSSENDVLIKALGLTTSRLSRIKGLAERAKDISRDDVEAAIKDAIEKVHDQYLYIDPPVRDKVEAIIQAGCIDVIENLEHKIAQLEAEVEGVRNKLADADEDMSAAMNKVVHCGCEKTREV